MRQLSLAEIKEHELKMMRFIDEVCKKNGLKYYLAFGTAIGAMRHKGFIPWDDDIDIFMPKEDLDKFTNIVQGNERYELMKPFENEYFYAFPKLVDKTTKIISKDSNISDSLGIWIDIFPLMGFSECISQKRLYYLDHARAASLMKKFPSKYKNRIGSCVYYLAWKTAILIGPSYFLRQIFKMLRRTTSFYSSKKVFAVETIVQYGGIFEKEIFGEGKDCEFEGAIFKVPDNVDAYLSQTYGNYMELPPIENRISHSIEAYTKK